MKKNQKGFSVGAILLFIAILGAVVGVGIYVYKNQNNKKAPTTAVISWQKYESTTHKISFSYPVGWEVLTADGSTGVNLDEIDKATFTYMVQDPQTSARTDIGVIAKPMTEVVNWRKGIYNGVNFYKNAGLDRATTEIKEFEFKGFKAVRFETSAKTAYPEGADEKYKKDHPQDPSYLSEIYIAGTDAVYSVIKGGQVPLGQDSIYQGIYNSLELH